jgi:hypothetical protein
VEDNVLKQIAGFDPAVFFVDILTKICGKLGFMSQKYTKAVCLETMLKAFKDLHAYNQSDTMRNNQVDSTSGHCRLLNALMSDALVAHFQMLASRKEMAEILIL